MIKPSTRTGTIEFVSVQSHNYFAVIRYDGVTLKDPMGNFVTCGKSIAGVPYWTPEETASLSEILIPLNISSTIQVTDPNLLIGARCIVHLSGIRGMDEYPLSATITGLDNSRKVSREYLWKIRNTNGDGIIDRRTKIITESEGYLDKSTLEDLMSERYLIDKYKGFIGVYDNGQDAFRTSQKDMENIVDMSSTQKKSNILGISTKNLRTRECYSLPTVFTGRS